jgi:hypothetical protein
MSQKVDHPLTVEEAFSRVESEGKAKHPSVTSCIDPDAFAVGDLDGQVRGYDYELEAALEPVAAPVRASVQWRLR